MSCIKVQHNRKKHKLEESEVFRINNLKKKKVLSSIIAFSTCEPFSPPCWLSLIKRLVSNSAGWTTTFSLAVPWRALLTLTGL